MPQFLPVSHGTLIVITDLCLKHVFEVITGFTQSTEQQTFREFGYLFPLFEKFNAGAIRLYAYSCLALVHYINMRKWQTPGLLYCYTHRNSSFVVSALAWITNKVRLDFWGMFGPSPFCPDFLLEKLVIVKRVAVFH